MELSENAERGKRNVAAASAVCMLISVLSIFTFNILLACIGIFTAHYLKQGSIAAKNVCIILRISDILVSAALIWVSYSIGGQELFRICFLPAVISAGLGMMVMLIISSSDAKAYFKEAFEIRQMNG